MHFHRALCRKPESRLLARLAPTVEMNVVGGHRAPLTARGVRAGRALSSSATVQSGRAVLVSRRSCRRGRVAFLGAKAAGKDVEDALNDVEGGTEATKRVLEQNATTVTKSVKLSAKAPKDMAAIVEKERQLAQAENNLVRLITTGCPRGPDGPFSDPPVTSYSLCARPAASPSENRRLLSPTLRGRSRSFWTCS